MTQMQDFGQWTDASVSGYDIEAREFVVATADGSDLRSFSPLCAVLRRMRTNLGIEAAFIAEAVRGETVVRQCRHDEPADYEALHVHYGQSLLAAQAQDGSQYGYGAVPILTRDHLRHGTLCCRGPEIGKAPDEAVMQAVAGLIGNWFDRASISTSGFAPLGGASVMGHLN